MIIWLCTLPLPAQAKQLQFDKSANQGGYTFSYQWLDINEQPLSFSFFIDNQSLFSRFRSFRAFKPEIAQVAIQRNIRKKIKAEPIEGVQAQFARNGQQVKLTSADPDRLSEAQQTITLWEDEYFEEYLHRNYYKKFLTHEYFSGIKPDHVRIALSSVDIFKPFKNSIIELVSIKDVRKVTNFILGFIQSIPYSTLESRVDSSGAGFSVPTKVLWENQGDCDSKMALTASMMRAVMPRIDLVFIYLDGHAILGVGIEPKNNDKYISVNGNVYVLADPTGPRLMNLGDVGFDTEQAINGNLYTTEIFEKVGN